jgi:hypothetical protein
MTNRSSGVYTREPAAAPWYVTVIDVVPPGSAGTTSKDANPNGVARFR